MHSSYTTETQPYVYGDYSFFLAEIASTTNENILTERSVRRSRRRCNSFCYFESILGWLPWNESSSKLSSPEFEHAIHKADQEGMLILTSEFLNNLFMQSSMKNTVVFQKMTTLKSEYEWIPPLTITTMFPIFNRVYACNFSLSWKNCSWNAQRRS